MTEYVCSWFALCFNDTTKAAPYPILGYVPCCDRCAEKMEITNRVEISTLSELSG